MPVLNTTLQDKINHFAQDIVDRYIESDSGHTESFQVIAKAIKSYIKQYDDQIKISGKMVNTDLVALSGHKLIDHVLDNSDHLKETITCKGSGCNHCCKMAVCVSSDEAILLLKTARRKKIKIDKEYLKLQSDFKNSNWHKLGKDYMPCVFLGDDGKCMVYDQRPAACRAHFSVSDPDLCDVEKHKGKRIGMWTPIDVAIINAAIAIWGKVDYMPIKLLEMSKFYSIK